MDDNEDTVDNVISVKDKAKIFDDQKDKFVTESQQPRQRVLSYVDPTTIDVDKEWCVITARCDYHRMAKRLLDNHLLSRARDPISGYTALHWACKHGNTDAVKMLAGTYKASVDAVTHSGYTPLHIAAMFKRKEVYQILQETYGADTNIRDYSGYRPSHYMRNLQDETNSKRSSYSFPDGIQIHSVIDLEKKGGHFKRRDSKELFDDTISITAYIKSGLESIRKLGRKPEDERPSVYQVVKMFESIDEEQSVRIGEQLARRYSADYLLETCEKEFKANENYTKNIPSLDTRNTLETSRRYSAGDIIETYDSEDDKDDNIDDTDTEDDIYHTLMKETYV